MKFTAVPPFLDYVKKNSLPHYILLVVEDSFERKFLINSVFPIKNSLAFSHFRVSEHSIGKVLEALDSPFLMGGTPQVVLEEGELLSKADIELILSIISQEYLGTFLIAAENKKNLLPLANEAEKKGISLDLSLEKVWDKEKRLSDYLKERCALHQKQIEEPAAKLIIDRSQRDFAYLANELEKLITFVGAQPKITLQDVKNIGTYLPQETVWKVAEKMVWEKKSLFSLLGEEQIDTNFFHSLVVALRYQLQFGLKLVSLSQDKSEVSSPQLASYSPWLITKRLPEAKKLGKEYFHKALLELFSIDLDSKNHVQDHLSLLVLFESKLFGANLLGSKLFGANPTISRPEVKYS